MQIFDDEKKRIGTLTGFRNRAITSTLDSGDKQLVFEYPAHGEAAELLKKEYYIRTKTDEYVIKAVEKSGDFNKYTALLNVEELEGQQFPYGFASREQTIRACLEFAFDSTGWTVGTCTVTKKRTIDRDENVSAWDVLQDCLKTYRCECLIDSINKRIDIYERIGEDRGCYFVEGLNLRKLTAKSDTYEFYTRIIPIGKDGITIEWLHGKEYLENFQYSKKIKTYTWKDERYTNTTSLLEDAEAKLDELSKPYEVYSADVADLASANPEYKNILDYGIGDTVRMVSKRTRTRGKQRIVKIVEYPETPEKNTVELSNTTKTFAEVQKAETELAKQEAISIANSTTKKVLQDGYYTKSEVETHITASEEKISLGVSEKYETKEIVQEKINGVIQQTDEKLTEYSTTEEMRSAIELSAENINLEVSKTYATQRIVTEKYNSAVKSGQDAANAAEAAANKATDTKLKNYSTTIEMKAAINVRAEEISSEVSKKVNSSDFGTKISQNAYYVRVAWNNNSNYIQFENGGISVYDGSVTESKKRAVFNYSGEHFYRDGYYVGKIGTNQWSGNDAHKGLVFDLDYQGKYMAFAQKASASASSYTTMLCFSRANSIYDTYGIHLGCDFDMHGFKLKNPSFEGGGITATIHYVQVLQMNSDGTVERWGANGMMQFKNGILVDLTYYT